MSDQWRPAGGIPKVFSRLGDLSAAGPPLLLVHWSARRTSIVFFFFPDLFWYINEHLTPIYQQSRGVDQAKHHCQMKHRSMSWMSLNCYQEPALLLDRSFLSSIRLGEWLVSLGEERPEKVLINDVVNAIPKNTNDHQKNSVFAMMSLIVNGCWIDPWIDPFSQAQLLLWGTPLGGACEHWVMAFLTNQSLLGS